MLFLFFSALPTKKKNDSFGLINNTRNVPVALGLTGLTPQTKQLALDLGDDVVEALKIGLSGL